MEKKNCCGGKRLHDFKMVAKMVQRMEHALRTKLSYSLIACYIAAGVRVRLLIAYYIGS